MMDAVIKDDNAWWTYGVPRDPDDFRRCHKLLTLFPEWRKRLPEVAAIFPEWTALVREWDTLEKMLPAWGKEPFNAMYDFMFQLREESMPLAGWVSSGSPGSWYRPETER